MKKFAIALAVGASALLGGSATNAADNSVKVQASTDIMQSTDMSSRHRRHWRQRVVYRSYSRPYYNDSYAYAPRPSYGSYGYAPQPQYYGGGGPGISFSFGGGGGHHGGGWGHQGW